MFCPNCRTEFREGFYECSDCQIPLVHSLPQLEADEPPESTAASLDDPYENPACDNLESVIRTSCYNPMGIALAKNLLREAGIPFCTLDQDPAPRSYSGNILGCLAVRVPREREAEARGILNYVDSLK